MFDNKANAKMQEPPKWESDAARHQAHLFCKGLALDGSEYYNCMDDSEHHCFCDGAHGVRAYIVLF